MPQQIRFIDQAGSERTGQVQNGDIESGGRTYATDEVDIRAPTNPSKIVCIGLNYHGHIEESDRERPDRPMLFLKGPNAVSGHRDTIGLLSGKDPMHYEAELGVVIGEQCRHVPESEAMDVVAGFTCANDISNREDQRQEQNWVRGKAFDNAAPMGPVLAPPEEVPDDSAIELRLNGETKQRASRTDLIFSIPELIEEITTYMTLERGDVILTGTPQGVGPVSDGDVVEVEIEGVGTLRNTFERLPKPK